MKNILYVLFILIILLLVNTVNAQEILSIDNARSFVINIDDACVSIESTKSVAFEQPDNRLILINTQLQTDVYFQCKQNQSACEVSCEVCCLVSFGKDPSK